MDEAEHRHDREHPRAEILASATAQKQKTSQRRNRVGQIGRAKKYPRDANPVDRQKPAQPFRDRARPFRRDMLLHVPDLRQRLSPSRPDAMDDERDSMQTAPDH